MNAESDAALAFLAEPAAAAGWEETVAQAPQPRAGDHWRWRMRVAEQIAARLDARRFGVKAIYVIGSTKNATATAGSDIDSAGALRGRARGSSASWKPGWRAGA